MKHTKDILADELEKAGLAGMAEMARTGYYHDFLSPLDMPCMQLSKDLLLAGTPKALAIRDRHHNGEFDASMSESDAWASSADGKEAFQQLVQSAKK